MFSDTVHPSGSLAKTLRGRRIACSSSLRATVADLIFYIYKVIPVSLRLGLLSPLFTIGGYHSGNNITSAQVILHIYIMDASKDVEASVPDGSSTDPSERHVPNANNGTSHELKGAEKRELQQEDCPDKLGFALPKWRKWWILTVIFLVQTSMNFNTSLYSNGLSGISEKFNVSEQAARVGAAIFLVFYAFGCELWAPWSEEFGRWKILQLSLGLVNIWTLPVALAPNFGCLLVGRALGGLSSAGGSVTLGMIADIFTPDKQQYAGMCHPESLRGAFGPSWCL